jgi:hypothetical protein
VSSPAPPLSESEKAVPVSVSGPIVLTVPLVRPGAGEPSGGKAWRLAVVKAVASVLSKVATVFHWPAPATASTCSRVSAPLCSRRTC